MKRLYIRFVNWIIFKRAEHKLSLTPFFTDGELAKVNAFLNAESSNEILRPPQ